MGFIENILTPILHSIKNRSQEHAICINNEYYTYGEFGTCISKIRDSIKDFKDTNVGLVANNDIETYASIIALWMEGKCYVPLHPAQPIERCLNIVKQVGMSLVLDSSKESRYKDINVISINYLRGDSCKFSKPKDSSDCALAYILFTSGSTGEPKGVAISRGNVSAFASAFLNLRTGIDERDRCLQMFDLTFDFSVQAYLIPLLVGACFYTLPEGKAKYIAVYNLMNAYHLTFMPMVPSIIHYLKPYMSEIFAPYIKCSLFCGESLLLDDVIDWCKCIPHAKILNMYGPTEATVFCSYYEFKSGVQQKNHNGIVCIGKPMENNVLIIVDDDLRLLDSDKVGELCISGPQVTDGYWLNSQKNKDSFFIMNGVRFYKSGDMCSMDSNGYLYYHERKDFQVKVQGFRVELGEIEYNARLFLKDLNVIALLVKSQNGIDEIALVIEAKELDTLSLLNWLKSRLPSYMIPSIVRFLPCFPINANGKIDRVKLMEIIK